MRVLDAEQAARLLGVAAERPLYALVYLALATGARLAELLGLRWQDVDLERRMLHIARSARRLQGRGVVFQDTKTHRSRRPVALSSQAVAVLRDHRRTQAEHWLAVGPAYAEQGLVFAGPTGRALDGGNARRAFSRITREAGLDPLRFHDLRHATATLLLGRSIHPKIVADMLGHSQISITLDLYSHVTPAMHEAAADALDSILGPSLRRPARSES